MRVMFGKRPRWSGSCGLLFLIGTIALGTALWWREGPWAVQQNASRLTNGFYVWQQRWTPAVSFAVEEAASKADGFLVLVAVCDASAGANSFQSVEPDWMVLARANRPLTLVIRMNSALPVALDAQALSQWGHALADVFRESLAVANAAGAQVAGFQVDYDSPTSQLSTYAQMLALAKETMPVEGKSLSITALPAWLRGDAFRTMKGTIDYFVLQVHGFERPRRISDPLSLFSAWSFRFYVRRAVRSEIPYAIALPTYGYTVLYDEHGDFAGLAAEGPTQGSGAARSVRRVMADPADIAPIVARLHKWPPKGCIGLVWFRMPVGTDTLNWSWPVLDAVMKGERP